MDKPDIEELKCFIEEYRVRDYKFPPVLLVEIIANCNLKCIMCPQDRLSRPVGKMTFELWKKIIDEVADKSPDTQIWPSLMGEPLLLGAEIFKWVKYANDRGVRVFLNTNLVMFQESWIDAFFDSGIFELIVSIDGITPETFEKIRINASLETLLERLNFILDEKEKRKLDSPVISLQYIVMDENVHEESAFIEYWKKQGKDVQLKIKRRTGWADGVKPWQDIVNYGQEERIPCTWLLRQMTIFWNGQVPQCDGDWNGQTKMGNVNEKNIEEIWNGKLKQARDMHMKNHFDFLPCNKCEDWQAGRSTFIQCGTK